MDNLKNKLTNIQNNLNLKYGSFSDEYIEQLLCLEYINKDDTVLEIGGNVGRVSLIISSIIDNSSNLVVVESDPDTCKYLRENRNNNNLQFIVVGGAISNVNLYVAPFQYPVSGVTYNSKLVKSFSFGNFTVAASPVSKFAISF